LRRDQEQERIQPLFDTPGAPKIRAVVSASAATQRQPTANPSASAARPQPQRPQPSALTSTQIIVSLWHAHIRPITRARAARSAQPLRLRLLGLRLRSALALSLDAANRQPPNTGAAASRPAGPSCRLCTMGSQWTQMHNYVVRGRNYTYIMRWRTALSGNGTPGRPTPHAPLLPSYKKGSLSCRQEAQPLCASAPSCN
jgi:hypothetical protein